MEHPNNSGPPAGASAVEVDPNLDATAKQIHVNTLTDNTITKDAECDCHLPHSICEKTIATVHILHIKSIPVVLPNIKNRHHPILSFIEFLVYFWTHNFML